LHRRPRLAPPRQDRARPQEPALPEDGPGGGLRARARMTHLKPRARRLYTRIYLHFPAMLLVVGLVTGAVFAGGWRAAFHRHFGERIARTVAHLLAERMDDPFARDSMVKKLAADLDVDLTLRDEK